MGRNHRTTTNKNKVRKQLGKEVCSLLLDTHVVTDEEVDVGQLDEEYVHGGHDGEQGDLEQDRQAQEQGDRQVSEDAGQHDVLGQRAGPVVPVPAPELQAGVRRLRRARNVIRKTRKLTRKKLGLTHKKERTFRLFFSCFISPFLAEH